MPRRMKVYRGTTAPVAGTDAVDTLTIANATGGTFKLKYGYQETAAITWSSTNATLLSNIDEALGALGAIGGNGNVTTAAGVLTAGLGTITVTYANSLGKLNVSALTVSDDSLTGTNAAVTLERTTNGVTATLRGRTKGTLYVDTTNAVVNINDGTAAAPTWNAV